MRVTTTKEEDAIFNETKDILPVDRPYTREETLRYVVAHYVEPGLKDEAKAKLYAKQLWIGNYVYAVNFNGWDKPPDWQEGEPVVDAACPKRPFTPNRSSWEREVYTLLAIQKGEI
jgi:hypothetical protein